MQGRGASAVKQRPSQAGQLPEEAVEQEQDTDAAAARPPDVQIFYPDGDALSEASSTSWENTRAALPFYRKTGKIKTAERRRKEETGVFLSGLCHMNGSWWNC